jgi:ribosomal protein L37E
MVYNININMTKTLEKKRVLTNFDFCDRCGAKAFVSASGMNGILYFCGHHFSVHELKLNKWAYKINDERKFID